MTGRHNRTLSVFLLTCVLVADRASSGAEQERYSAGQNVAPVFEGWAQNADGSYDFYYGYLNRNWVEQPIVPVGAANMFSPGEPDRGQPTFFYPRRNLFVFSVRVPKGWGPKDELVWKVTVNGRTDFAYGWLKPEWEIDELLIARNANNQGGREPDEIFKNKPPTVTVDPVAGVTLPNAVVTLTAHVSDDNLPAPQPKRERPKGLETLSAPPAPINVPIRRETPMPRNDLSMKWTLHRGPASVTFEPDGYQVVKAEGAARSGAAKTTVRFEKEGSYVLRGWAADGVAQTPVNVTVTVGDKSPPR
jgi:hypothetical protein